MISGGGGSVINMTSDAGIRSDATHIAYGVSKAGVILMTHAIATHHGKQGVRANAIAPALVVTPYVHKVAAELIDLLDRPTPSPQPAEPEHVAALAAILSAAEALFINGQIIRCDGGLLSHMPQTADLADWIANNLARE